MSWYEPSQMRNSVCSNKLRYIFKQSESDLKTIDSPSPNSSGKQSKPKNITTPQRQQKSKTKPSVKKSSKKRSLTPPPKKKEKKRKIDVNNFL